MSELRVFNRIANEPTNGCNCDEMLSTNLLTRRELRFGHHHNCEYVQARNNLIPAASAYASFHTKPDLDGDISGARWTRLFAGKMDELAKPLLAILLLCLAIPVPLKAQTPIGIASHYPGDKNISYDPAVILADDFENYTLPNQLTEKWSQVYHLPNLRIATEADHVFSGRKSLEMSLPISTAEVSNVIGHHFNPTLDTVFIRSYCKFDAGYSLSTSNHNGLRLSAKYPGPGKAPNPNGTGFFLFLVQNQIMGVPRLGEIAPGFTHVYSYWPKQRTNYGDHWYPTGSVVPGGTGDWLKYPAQYPDFKPLSNFLPQRDRWYCYELMVKANTPGKNDGEVKYWIDGAVVSDFPDLNMRSISTLKIDTAHIVLHAIHSERLNKKWYDNVVIATKYIGPMIP